MRKPNIHIMAAWFSLLTFLVTVALFGLVAYWLIYPYKVIDIVEPLEITQKELEHGDVLSYVVKFCKFMPIAGRVTNHITNGKNSFTYDTVTLDAKTGCGESVSNRLVIPNNVPYGEKPWRMEVLVEYEPNPFRTIKMTVVSEQFYIRGKQ